MEEERYTKQNLDNTKQVTDKFVDAVFLSKKVSIEFTPAQYLVQQKDKALVVAAQNNPEEFKKIYVKYKLDVYNYFLHHFDGQGNLAEDLTQDTFFQALKFLSTFRHTNASYRTYLLRIAHNLLVNYYRKKKSLPLQNAEHIKSDEDGAFRDIIRESNLWQMVDGLSEVERTIVNLFYKEELSVREVATIMQKTENAVKLHLSRSRKRLREIL